MGKGGRNEGLRESVQAPKSIRVNYARRDLDLMYNDMVNLYTNLHAQNETMPYIRREIFANSARRMRQILNMYNLDDSNLNNVNLNAMVNEFMQEMRE